MSDDRPITFESDDRQIIVLVGPSGTGKSTLANIISAGSGIHRVRSYTDRPSRKDETIEDYHFVDSDRMNSIIAQNSLFAIMEHNAHVPGLVQLYIEFSAEASIGLHPAHEYFTERYEWVRGQLAQIVRAAQEADEMGQKADPDEIATLMVAAADGLQQQWLLDRSIDMVARLRRLWDGVVAHSHRAVVTQS